jgi:hypothetical protein
VYQYQMPCKISQIVPGSDQVKSLKEIMKIAVLE